MDPGQQAQSAHTHSMCLSADLCKAEHNGAPWWACGEGAGLQGQSQRSTGNVKVSSGADRPGLNTLLRSHRQPLSGSPCQESLSVFCMEAHPQLKCHLLRGLSPTSHSVQGRSPSSSLALSWSHPPWQSPVIARVSAHWCSLYPLEGESMRTEAALPAHSRPPGPSDGA